MKQSSKSNSREKIPTQRFKQVPTNKDPEIISRYVLQTNRRGKLANETDAVDHEAGQSKTFGSGGCFESLGGNYALKWGVRKRKDNVEKVVEGQGDLTKGPVNCACICFFGDQRLGDAGVYSHSQSACYLD